MKRKRLSRIGLQTMILVLGLGLAVWWGLGLAASAASPPAAKTAISADPTTATPAKSDPAASAAPVALKAIKIPGLIYAPRLVRTPASLTATSVQGANALGQSFVVHNSGSASLKYAITDNASWLTVTPGSGTSGAGIVTHRVAYATAKLPRGIYRAKITIATPNVKSTPQTIDVTLAVRSPGEPTVTITSPSLNVVVPLGTTSYPFAGTATFGEQQAVVK
jgi:hypothetical protein